MKNISLPVIFAFGIAVAIVLGPTVSLVSADAMGQKLLDDMISKAKKEGELRSSVITSFPGRISSKLENTFKKRFGLNIDVSLPVVNPTQYAPKAAAETRARVVPPYDTYVGSGKNAMQLLGLGGVEKIPNWEALLAAINPQVRSGSVRAKRISPDPFSGYAFQYLPRPRSILYNPKLISKKELPKTHADLGNPIYKGRWITPPYTSDWDTGLLVFPEMPKGQWIKIIRKAGKNAGAILGNRASTTRVLLGEFAFFTAAVHNFLHLKS